MIDLLIRVADKLALGAAVGLLAFVVWSDIKEVQQVELGRQKAMSHAEMVNTAMRSNDHLWPPEVPDEAQASGKVLTHWKAPPGVGSFHRSDFGP